MYKFYYIRSCYANSNDNNKLYINQLKTNQNLHESKLLTPIHQLLMFLNQNCVLFLRWSRTHL